MSDLTSRVLDEYDQPTTHCDDCGTATNIDWMIDAAPILARQIEAVELRCAAMESEGQPLAYAAALIRDALTEAAKETDR